MTMMTMMTTMMMTTVFRDLADRDGWGYDVDDDGRITMLSIGNGEEDVD